MNEYVLRVAYRSRPDLDDHVETALFLFRSKGSSIEEGEEGSTLVTLWFETETDRAKARGFLERKSDLSVEEMTGEQIDWLDHYEQSLEAIEVGSRWIVAARADLIDDGERIALLIPQERAFGTGSHASTALCLEMMGELDLEKKSCLDIGAGTGILSIAAARLGAERVLALEIDTDAIGPLLRNPRQNGISPGSVSSLIGTIDALNDSARFDLVLMNILPHVIIPVLGRVRSFLRTGGSLIISGVIESEIENVRAALDRARLTIADQRRCGEWWGARLEGHF